MCMKPQYPGQLIEKVNQEVNKKLVPKPAKKKLTAAIAAAV